MKGQSVGLFSHTKCAILDNYNNFMQKFRTAFDNSIQQIESYFHNFIQEQAAFQDLKHVLSQTTVLIPAATVETDTSNSFDRWFFSDFRRG